MIFLTSSCGARIAVPANSVVDAARLLESVLNSDRFAVNHSAAGVQVGEFDGMKLVKVWEFGLARSVEFVSPVAWQEGLLFALSGRRLALVG